MLFGGFTIKLRGRYGNSKLKLGLKSEIMQ